MGCMKSVQSPPDIVEKNTKETPVTLEKLFETCEYIRDTPTQDLVEQVMKSPDINNTQQLKQFIREVMIPGQSQHSVKHTSHADTYITQTVRTPPRARVPNTYDSPLTSLGHVWVCGSKPQNSVCYGKVQSVFRTFLASL